MLEKIVWVWVSSFLYQGQTAEMYLLVQAAIIPHLNLLWMELRHRP